MNELVVGSRGSALALAQTGQVIEQIEGTAGVKCRVEVIKTQGDKVTDVPLSQIGEKGLFVKELEAALLSGEIDLAVHSAKDMPSELPPGLVIAAFPKREDPSDALISTAGLLADLPTGAKVGTSSVRRQAQLLSARPDLRMIDLRGNLDTRLRKVESDDYDAVVLACAGLRRMGWESRITQVLSHDVCLPAAGQGALALQCRDGDPVADVLAAFDHASTRRCVSAERALLRTLGAGCQTPVAALAEEAHGEIVLRVAVASLDGSRVMRMSLTGPAEQFEELGARLGEAVLLSGGREILDEVRCSAEPKTTGAA